ncbi:hypothetical protein [Pedobacter kyonggii]|uniref:hypothetical protein n=1 Tax=Pedobacter kyonggii TaxID=1926871 RepID=UPI0013EF1B31|nr:hypothetical protein [Pedobacter kyonggii]
MGKDLIFEPSLATMAFLAHEDRLSKETESNQVEAMQIIYRVEENNGPGQRIS